MRNLFFVLLVLLNACSKGELSEPASLVVSTPPVAENITLSDFETDEEVMITLNYSGRASQCSLSNLQNVSISTPCSCDTQGICSVGVRGNRFYQGSASFDYTVSSNSLVSNEAQVGLDLIYTPKAFVSVWRVGASGFGDGDLTVSLPLTSRGTFNFHVDWGDGSEPSHVTTYWGPEKDHTYLEAGDYKITITGSATVWYFDGWGDSDKIIAVTEFGDLGWRNLERAFHGCRNLKSFAGGRTDQVTNMNSMFSATSSLEDVDLSSFDTSNVTDMRFMFYNSFGVDTALEKLDLSSFDTSNVTDMAYMFGAQKFLKELNLSSFDTREVIVMNDMFYDTLALENLDVSRFNTSKVTNMAWMFYRATAVKSLDLRHFDVSQVTNMDYLFHTASSLENLNVTGWNLNPSVSSSYMFSNTLPSLVVQCDFASGMFDGESCQ